MRVAVIGAGVAGLAAARELGRHRVRVTLLEESPRVGGCVRAVSVGDTHLEVGPRFFHRFRRGPKAALRRAVRASGFRPVDDDGFEYYLIEGALHEDESASNHPAMREAVRLRNNPQLLARAFETASPASKDTLDALYGAEYGILPENMDGEELAAAEAYREGAELVGFDRPLSEVLTAALVPAGASVLTEHSVTSVAPLSASGSAPRVSVVADNGGETATEVFDGVVLAVPPASAARVLAPSVDTRPLEALDSLTNRGCYLSTIAVFDEVSAVELPGTVVADGGAGVAYFPTTIAAAEIKTPCNGVPNNAGEAEATRAVVDRFCRLLGARTARFVETSMFEKRSTVPSAGGAAARSAVPDFLDGEGRIVCAGEAYHKGGGFACLTGAAETGVAAAGRLFSSIRAGGGKSSAGGRH